MSTDTSTNAAAGINSLEDLYAALPARNYEPLWTMKGALTPEPVTSMVPCLWHYQEVRDLIVRAGELISAQDADRRVLAMKNPGTGPDELARATDTLWAAMQLVLPGEVAPPHRHTAAALRYIVEGSGGYTVVDGRRVDMERGDFVLTPNWSSHEHGHAGEGPMIWLDGLDLPMVHTLRLIFAEFGFDVPESKPSAAPALRSGELKPRWAGAAPSSTLVWKLADVLAALEDLRGEDGSPFDDLILEYRDPATNGPAMRTMSAYMQLLRPGVETQAHRHTSSAVYHVAQGSGTSVINGERLDWVPGDTFALPTWAEHSHINPGGEDALLFSFSDEPSIDALGLLRERASS
jgi:gentisate 1,2-dioxygenase